MSSFDAPAIDSAFEDTAPRRSHAAAAMVAVAILLGVAVFLPGVREWSGGRMAGIAYLLPWLFLALLLGAGWLAARRVRSMRRSVSRAWEAAQLEEWDVLAQGLRGLLQKPIRGSGERGQVLHMLGSLVEHQGSYALAARTYERMLTERIGDAYLLQSTQLSLVYCKLRSDELTDAIRMLDRLEQVPMPDALRARFEWIRLFQRVYMGHDRDALERLDERVPLFRRQLSTRAGFPYALAASALHRQNRPAEAEKFWSDATALIPADRLMNDYPMCRETGVTYPAVEHCV